MPGPLRAAALTALLGLPLSMACAAAPAIAVLKSTAVASIPGSPMTVVYLTLRNEGAQADRLIGASTPLASMVQLHSAQVAANVASMRPAEGFDVPAHGQLALINGGSHLMLMGLTGPLRAGASLPLTLKFKLAGEVKILVPVLPAAGN